MAAPRYRLRCWRQVSRAGLLATAALTDRATRHAGPSWHRCLPHATVPRYALCLLTGPHSHTPHFRDILAWLAILGFRLVLHWTTPCPVFVSLNTLRYTLHGISLCVSTLPTCTTFQIRIRIPGVLQKWAVGFSSGSVGEVPTATRPSGNPIHTHIFRAVSAHVQRTQEPLVTGRGTRIRLLHLG